MKTRMFFQFLYVSTPYFEDIICLISSQNFCHYISFLFRISGKNMRKLEQHSSSCIVKKKKICNFYGKKAVLKKRMFFYKESS